MWDSLWAAALLQALEAVVDARAPIVPSLAFAANLADYGAAAGASAEQVERSERELEAASGALRRAHEAGVPLLCGSDSGFRATPVGEWAGREMEVFVTRLGLTPLQARLARD